MWAVDPPEYYTEGLFVRLVGPLYTAAQRVAIERAFPEWSPQRHMRAIVHTVWRIRIMPRHGHGADGFSTAHAVARIGTFYLPIVLYSRAAETTVLTTNYIEDRS